LQLLSTALLWISLATWPLAQAADGGAPKAKNGGGGVFDMLFANPLIPFLLIGIVFYLLLMRPEQKKRKEMEQTLSNLKRNDRVVTIGGICGTVVNVSPGSNYVTLRVDDSNNTRVRVLRSAISRVGEPTPSDDESGESS
jgi:preprotein translocase subunit YajC